MIFDDKDGLHLNDLARRLANIIRLGKVDTIDYANARARVRIGNLLTDWLPWITQCAGNTANWCPIEVDEQVVILSTGGDLCQGVILPSLYRCNNPSSSPQLHTTHYSDGSTISFDIATGTLTADVNGDVNITAQGSVNVRASGHVSVSSAGSVTVQAKETLIKSPEITLDGNVTITGNMSGHGTMRLGGDGKPVARIGDSVEVSSSSHKGTITSGSSRVSAG